MFTFIDSCLALKIHISYETAAALEKFGTFSVELRGEVEIKVIFFCQSPWVRHTRSLLCVTPDTRRRTRTTQKGSKLQVLNFAHGLKYMGENL